MRRWTRGSLPAPLMGTVAARRRHASGCAVRCGAATADDDEERAPSIASLARTRGSQLPPIDREPLVVDGDARSPSRSQKRASRRSSRRAAPRAPDTPRRPRTRAGRGRRRPPATSRMRGRRRRASAVVAMQVMTAGSGASGSCGYSSRVRCARGYADSGPNWRVGRRLVVGQQDLGVAPEHAQAAAEQLELARRVGADAPAVARARARTGCRGASSSSPNVEERVGRSRRRERVVGEAGARSERVRRAACGRERVRVVRLVGSGPTRRRPSHDARAAFEPAVGVLPVVAGAMVEARVGARRDQREARRVVDVDDPDRPSAELASRTPAASARGRLAHEVDQPAVMHERRRRPRSGPGSRSASQAPRLARTRAWASAHRRPATAPAHRTSRAAGRAPARRTAARSPRSAPTCSRTCRACRAGDRAHRHVVLLVGARRDRVGRRRMRQHLVLRRQGGGRVLQEHQPRVQAGVRREEGRQPAVQARVEQQRRPPLADRARAPRAPSFAKSSARAIGSPWKLPPLMTWPPPVATASASARRRPPGTPAGCRWRAFSSMSRTRRRWSSASRTAPWTCGHAAQRVRVLDLVRARVVARLERRVAQELAELGGDLDLVRDAAGRAGTPRRTRRPCPAAPRRSSPRRRWRSASAGPRRRGAAPRARSSAGSR